MSKSLVVVESPAKARTISKYLGKDFKVLATMGHIRDLPTNRLGVDLQKGFRPEYIPVKGKEKAMTALKKAAKEADRVLLASDFDREGEAIAWHVAEELKLPKSKTFRVTFNEVTKGAILEAIEQPGRINGDLVDSQQARRILDRIVGYQISPLLWEKIRRGLSAGRVQSVAVRLVVEREQEIQNFKSQEYWTIDAEGEGKMPPPFKMTLIGVDGEQILLRPEAKKRTATRGSRKRLIETETDAQVLVREIGKGELTVVSVEQRQSKRNPSPPFITSTLQQEAHRKLRYTPKKTMLIAQRLYEGVELGEEGTVGLITYMRTDSTRIADSAIEALRGHIKEKYGKDYLPKAPNRFKTKKGAQDAHEAIRPTQMLEPAEIKEHLSPDQLKLYTLIWNRTIACQMAPAKVLQTRIELENKRKHRFAATGSVIEFPGFLSVYEEGKDEGDENGNGSDTLPALKEGDLVKLKSVTPNQHFTQPPPRFSGASLVKELEARGIGRPSTYAQIVSVIQEKDYVELEKARFKPTELGIMVTSLLVESFPEILDAKFTALMEEQLDQVEEGKVNWVDLLGNFYDGFRRRVDEAKVGMRNLRKETVATEHECEKCGRPMVIKWGRNGRFLACSGYPECRNTREVEGENGGRPAQQTAPGQVCPNCGKELVVKMGRRGRFAACPGYPDCKHSEPLRTGVRCPREGCEGHIVERQSKKGRTFFACDQYPNCDETMWEQPVAEECPECKNPYLVAGKGPLRGRLKCPKCTYKKPSEPGAQGDDEE